MAGLNEHYAAVVEMWSQTVERNLCNEFQYSNESFWYPVQTVSPNVKFELPSAFETHEPIFRLVCLDTDDISQLMKDFAIFQSYEMSNIVECLWF